MRFEEYDRNADARDAGLLQWNTSQHDRFWRGWLTSRELFDTIRETVPRIGKRIHSLSGGDVFECGRDRHCWIRVWTSSTDIVVAYPSIDEQYGLHDQTEWPQEFEEWIAHLRGSEPLELGQVRRPSTYGAHINDEQSLPTVKWAQAGDWASIARGWFIENRRGHVTWP